MNFINRLKSSYRTYFKQRQLKHPLKKEHRIQMVLSFVMFVGIILLVGIITNQITSFLYVFGTTTILIIKLGFLYTYFTYSKQHQKHQSIYLIPWLKWLNMFLWYQVILLQNIYIELVPIWIIFGMSIYLVASMLVLYSIERSLKMKSSMIIKTISTAVFLYLGHHVFLNILPITHVTVSYIFVLMSMSGVIAIKEVLKKNGFKPFKVFEHKNIRMSYYILVISLYLIFTSIGDISQTYGFAIFNQEDLIQHHIKIKDTYTFENQEIIQMVADQEKIYIKTIEKVYILDHNLMLQHTIRNETMDLIETNQGVMLIEYQSPNEQSIDDFHYFSLYEINRDGQMRYYMSHYIEKTKHISYIHFEGASIYYFLPVHHSGLSGYVDYYDGHQFVKFEMLTDPDLFTEHHIEIQTDDVIIGFRGTCLFGVHRTYGTYTWCYQTAADGITYLDRYEISFNNIFYRPRYYGYQHTLHVTAHSYNHYYHQTFDTRHPTIQMGQFFVDHKIFIMEDGSFYLLDKYRIIHYDGYFNALATYDVEGIQVETLYHVDIESSHLFYTIEDTLYSADLNQLGAYQIIKQDSPLRWIGLILFFGMFSLWKTYTIRPDDY